MPNRPDLREIATNVREAFAAMDRDALLAILTFVVKEYVVEGPPPMLVHQAETLSDLNLASFAQLVSALQTRFDFPELAMFVVDGDSVGVRIGGVVHALVPQRTALGGSPSGALADSATLIDTRPSAGAARPRPGVRIVETELQQRPQPASGASAPPPSRGLSLRGRPKDASPESGDGASAPGGTAAAPANPGSSSSAPAPNATPSPASPGPAAPAVSSGAPEKSDKPEGSGDDASARFSLLELD